MEKVPILNHIFILNIPVNLSFYFDIKPSTTPGLSRVKNTCCTLPETADITSINWIFIERTISGSDWLGAIAGVEITCIIPFF